MQDFAIVAIMPGHLEVNPTKGSKNPNSATWKHEHPHWVLYPTQKEPPMLKAIAAVLKHDLGWRGGMLAEDAALKYQVARSTFCLKLKDWRVGKYVLLTANSNRSEAQMKLSARRRKKSVIGHYCSSGLMIPNHLLKSAVLQPL